MAGDHGGAFKPEVARKWVELVYEGFFHDPLKADLDAFLRDVAGPLLGGADAAREFLRLARSIEDHSAALIDDWAKTWRSGDPARGRALFRQVVARACGRRNTGGLRDC